MGFILLALGYVIGGALYVEKAVITDLREGTQGYADMLDHMIDSDQSGVEYKHKFFGWLKRPSLLLNGGGVIGIGIAMIVWCVLTLSAFFVGDSALLRTAGAHEIRKEDAPQLWNTVEEMTIASGLPSMPRVFIIDDDTPNAFAVGRQPQNAAVAVTAGLLKRMNRDELQGVVAHEVGHIHNYDIRFMTLASVMVGSIVLISEVFLRSLWYGSGRRSSSSRGGGGAQIVFLVVAVLFAVLAPIVARLLYFACSRRREYLADACAARFTRFPDGLASALEKIGAASGYSEKKISRSLAPLYIVNPSQSMSAVGLFSTHPPLHQRVSILRSMAGGAGYVDYETAYKKINGSESTCLNPAFLKSESALLARKPTPESEPRQAAVARAREAIDVIDRAANFLLLPCLCGLRMKLPPDLSVSMLKCPRCGRSHNIPKVESGPPAQPKSTSKSLTYRRKTTGWESFQCECGHNIQLSPSFSAAYASCKKCGRHIKIQN